MSYYRVIVRKSPGWRNHEACTLGVSVTSPNWQDEKFASILEFAAKNFQKIRIDVTDALYRHNFMSEGLPPDQALAQANALGALWLTQHQDLIDDCPIKPQIIRWAEWYQHPDFADTFAGFQRAHAVNDDLREAVHDDAMGFYRRKQCQPTLIELECSKNYLIEELAVITLQARELPSLKIYPGDELSCFSVVRHGLVPEAPKGLDLEQFAKVKFEARNHTAANDFGANLTRGKVIQFAPADDRLVAG